METQDGNKNTSGAKVGAAAAGIGAALAAAAGAYWLYGAKDAAKNRRMAKSWMLKARADVMDAVEKVQNLDRKQYMAIVDTVVGAAAGAAAASRPEITRVTRDLRAAWNQMAEQMRSNARSTKRTAKRSAARVKKSAKKAVGKSSRK